MTLTKTSMNKSLRALALIASLIFILSGHERVGFAQSGFEGDYDPGFGTNGYTVEPQFPDPARSDRVNTNFSTGDMMSDGSLVAGGYLQQLPESYDRVFYIKKFTPSGALDTSFNGGKGFIIPDFYVLDTNVRGSISLAGTAEAEENLVVRAKDSYIAKLKVLPDNKILVVGVCDMSGKTQFSTHGATDSPIIGPGVCMMRFNPDGTLDTTFGTAGEFTFAHRDPPYHGFLYREVQGIVWTPIGNQPITRYPGETSNLDLVIQPDNKILIAGETRTRLQPHINTQVPSGFLLRYTSQGALDTGFGQNGAIHYHGNPDQFGECTPRRRFFGVAVQPDGRILAMGSDGTVDTGDCANRHGNRFVVTRWTASGQLETSRYLDNNTAFFYGQRERAMAAVFTAGGSKVIVSGSYNCKHTLVKFNVSNLSLDTTFGTNGIAGYSEGCNTSTGLYGNTLNVQTIQPDGKILGLENPLGPGRLTRFNPDGSADLSFGNENFENAGQPGTGSLYVNVLHFNGLTNRLHPLHLLVRPNGRINLFGYSYTYDIYRAVVSQQNTELPTYTLSGRVLNGSGVGVAGVTVNLSGAQSASRVTDASGNYSFTELAMGGSYNVTPSKAGLTFVPASKSFTNLSADQLSVNFAVPSLSVNNVAVTEGNTGEATATFTVRLQPASTQPVTVKYATANSTALAPGDYTALALTALTFSPGQTAKTVAVKVKGDKLDEANETFRLLLSAPTNALISDNEGTGTITDDDAPPSVKVNNVAVTEGNSAVSAIFTVSLSAPSARTVTVKYQTANGTAVAPSDYTPKALTALTFSPFQTTKTVTVLVAGDFRDEAAENFKLLLSSPTNATIAVGAGACTITDNDPPPSITITNATVTEPDTGTVNAVFTVKLSAASGQTVSVKYATGGGTAAAGTDYTALALTTLTFSPGQTSKTVAVQVKGDTVKEANETFFLNLSGATKAAITDAQGQGTITNDD